MKSLLTVSAAIAVVAATSFTMVAPASAGGLYDRMSGGSLKDAPMVQHHGRSSSCYVRGDVGYSVSTDPVVGLDSPVYAARGTDDEGMDGGFMGEIGVGCGQGNRGFRGDLTLGYRWDRDVDGIKTDRPGVHFPGDFSTKVNTLTAMANLYYDLGNFRNFVPYIGAGIGIAHHNMGDVSFDLRNPGPGPAANPVNNLQGSEQTNFAWAVMAGAGYKISDRTMLDFGYRFIDMGDVKSKRGNMCNTCVPGGSQDRLTVNDMYAHEFKVGLRYHFGGSRSHSYK